MRYIPLENDGQLPYKVAVLVKEASFKPDSLMKYYLKKLPKEFNHVAIAAPYDTPKKVKVTSCREFLADALAELDSVGIDYILCADPNYFKALTKEAKTDANIGYVKNCVMEGFQHIKVVYTYNHGTLFFKPDNIEKMNMAMDALTNHIAGTYQALGTGIIHHEEYPSNYADIEAALEKLHQRPMLAADIEGFSLKHYECGVATIGFSWNEHEGLVIPCDYSELDTPLGKGKNIQYGEFLKNEPIRALLKKFLTEYKGILIWHGATFDLKCLIYALWMDDILDREGLLEGLDIVTSKFHCTKTITYLAINSTSGNKLSLKDIAHEFAGNWAQSDIKDIRKIPLDKLMRYNLVDCLSTFWTFNKYYPMMVTDEQEDLYNGLFKESLVTITEMELTGAPMVMDKVKEAGKFLRGKRVELTEQLRALEPVREFENTLRMTKMLNDHAKWKTKTSTIDEYDGVTINPNSGVQLQKLIYDHLGYDVIDLTDAGQPSTSGDTLKKLKVAAKNETDKEMFECLIELAQVAILIDNFVVNFEKAVRGPDGHYYIFGNFNLGGTVSGRLSSSSPNLQNLPSGGKNKYAKLLKACFAAPKRHWRVYTQRSLPIGIDGNYLEEYGHYVCRELSYKDVKAIRARGFRVVEFPGWIFCGADFASLEDRISALTTKDSNKLRVYTDGYCGHSLRAYAYFPDRLPDIQKRMEEAKVNQRFFKITHDNGSTEVVSETEMVSRGIAVPN